MTRKISLYLAGTRADLADDALVVFNYAFSDLYNPAIIKNSYSQTVTLPGTDVNNRLFGSVWRLDRVVGNGFNPSKRVPFRIFSDGGEVLESGYARLDRVLTAAGGIHSYEVSLFGGMGDFIYGLAYDSAGNKRSLASLDYLGGGDAELDFTITADAVRSAWARLGGDTSQPQMWDVINFAPCYNGIPDGDFDAGKAIAVPGDIGLADSVTIDGVTYGPSQSGHTLVSLPEDRDEWEMKDLRSYLQRPVLSVAAFFAAIAKPENNGGWSVDLSDLTANWPYLNTWLTRPLLPSLGTYKQTTGGKSVTFNPTGWATSRYIGNYNLNDAAAGEVVTAALTFTPAFQVAGGPASLLSWRRFAGQSYVPDGNYQQVLFVQAVGIGAGDVEVAAGPVKAYYHDYGRVSPEAMAQACGFTPNALNTNYAAAEDEVPYALSTGSTYARAVPMSAEISGADIARIDICVTAYSVLVTDGGAVTLPIGGTAPYTQLYDAAGNDYTPTAATIVSGSGTATSQTAETLRSGAHITKAMLLSTDGTPADYLVDLCKTFGLTIQVDAARKAVTIARRCAYFVAETIDLSPHIDRSHDIEIVPLAFDAKWYDFKHESVGGAFADEYAATEGVQYGIQRVDTGYDFDAEEKDLLSGGVLRDCAAVMARSPYFLLPPGGVTPPVFIAPGNKYTLWDADGKATEIDVPQYTGATSPWNRDEAGYDVAPRAEFRDKDNGPEDGADVLLFGWGNTQSLYENFAVTDDLPAMGVLNGGVPCWILAPNTAGQSVPLFSRYGIMVNMQTGRTIITQSLDMGVPRQMDIPNVTYTENRTIYAQAWQSFIRDRLSVDNKVLRCRVTIPAGMTGGWPGLMRRFWWYGGSLWVLNKIENYSLTTFDPAECEFVQVRDIDNYTTGQY